MIFDFIQQLPRLPSYLGRPHRLSPPHHCLIVVRTPWPFNRDPTPRTLLLNKKIRARLLRHTAKPFCFIRSSDPDKAREVSAAAVEHPATSFDRLSRDFLATRFQKNPHIQLAAFG
jgi:hypothetical protein